MLHLDRFVLIHAHCPEMEQLLAAADRGFKPTAAFLAARVRPRFCFLPLVGGKTRIKARNLSYPDLLYLRAAEGWLELANPSEAGDELDQITSEFRTHPDVLVLRWRIYASLGKLDKCLTVASRLTEIVPDDERGWRALARTLCLRGEVRHAYQIALAKMVDYPRSWEFFYDTARYACLLGRTDEAHEYLQLAMAAGEAKHIKARALEDPDLERLWRAQDK